MTYFAFLLYFLAVPLALLAGLTWLDRRAGRSVPAALRGQSLVGVVAAHVLVALVYTTPWDNYLVATRVWWYDPALVTGLVLGWVPIEEYTFFILQTILGGLWLLWLARRGAVVAPPGAPDRPRLRVWSALAAGAIWLASVGMLVAGWQPGTYLGLELVWALPPIVLQLIFGADILWHRRRLVLPAILVPALYLSAMDTIAIQAGTWTINPAQSTGVLLGGVLPVEELVFFLLTNTLIGFGITLVLSVESQPRARALAAALRGRFGRRRAPEPLGTEN